MPFGEPSSNSYGTHSSSSGSSSRNMPQQSQQQQRQQQQQQQQQQPLRSRPRSSSSSAGTDLLFSHPQSSNSFDDGSEFPYPPYSELPFTSLKRRKQTTRQGATQFVKWAMRIVLASPVIVLVMWSIGAMIFSKSVSHKVVRNNSNSNSKQSKMRRTNMMMNGQQMMMMPQQQQQMQQQQQLQQAQMQQGQNNMMMYNTMGQAQVAPIAYMAPPPQQQQQAQPVMGAPQQFTFQQQQQQQPVMGAPNQFTFQQQQQQQQPNMGAPQQFTFQQQQESQPVLGAAANAITPPIYRDTFDMNPPLMATVNVEQLSHVLLDPKATSVGVNPMRGTMIVQPQAVAAVAAATQEQQPLMAPQMQMAEEPKMQQQEQPKQLLQQQQPTILYYDPKQTTTDSNGQLQLPKTVYDAQGTPVDLAQLQQQQPQMLLQAPLGATATAADTASSATATTTATTEQQEHPQFQDQMVATPAEQLAVGELKKWGESTSQDQSIIVATVAVMALLVGALSARRMRAAKSILSACIENESLEDDLAYDAAYTTTRSRDGSNADSSYNTFGWKGDLEKFDV